MSADPRARWKESVRQYPVLSHVLQWIFDPAYTPRGVLKRALSRFERSHPNGLVLNFGSGSRSYGPKVFNLDTRAFAHVHLVHTEQFWPFGREAFQGCLLEYVLEHVSEPEALLRAVDASLTSGARVWITVPWKQNYHPCPQDFMRWSHEGLSHMIQKLGWKIESIEAYGGPISAWIDQTKEVLALILSFGHPTLFGLLSQLLILPFLPLRFLDIVLRKLPQAEKISFSLLLVASKPGDPPLHRPALLPSQVPLFCACGREIAARRCEACGTVLTSAGGIRTLCRT